jgi:hypothetical protein
MDSHLTADEIAQYQARQMTADGVLRVREHIDGCEECRSRLGQAPSNAAVVRAFLDPEPDEQELVLFAAGRLSGDRARAIEAHLAGCADCREAVEDLRQFGGQPRARRRPVPLWWGAVAAAILVGVYLLTGGLAPPPIASLRDGKGRITLSRSGELKGVLTADEQERTLIAEALRTGRLPLNAAAAPDAGVLRGSGDSPDFQLLEPSGRRMSNRPEFRWSAVSGASEYDVTVFTEDEQVVAEAWISRTQWQPEGTLPRGVRLHWQVTAKRGKERITAPAPPAPRASFEIVPDDVAQRLRKIHGNLPLAVAYAHEGMLHDAQDAINSVVQANPDSTLAKQLRDSLLVK